MWQIATGNEKGCIDNERDRLLASRFNVLISGAYFEPKEWFQRRQDVFKALLYMFQSNECADFVLQFVAFSIQNNPLLIESWC